MKLDLERILREVKSYRQRHAIVDPKHAALLVIDMQTYFRRIAQTIMADVLAVIQVCRRRRIPIIFTQHGHTDQASGGKELGEWWGQMIVRGTEDWRFLQEIQIEPNEIILPKRHYSAFLETDLDTTLQSRGIKDLIISGVMTNLCCETTARDAFMRDYRVFFLVDGTAAGRGDLHLASLKNLGYGFAYLMTCEELIWTLKDD